jgi:streptogramin lyase
MVGDFSRETAHRIGLVIAVVMIGWTAPALAQNASPLLAAVLPSSRSVEVNIPATTQTITEFPVPTANAAPFFISAGSDGALWFTENGAPKIGRISVDGTISEFQDTSSNDGGLWGITAGPDGALWFTNVGTEAVQRITVTGATSDFPEPNALQLQSGPLGITAGPDGALWAASGIRTTTNQNYAVTRIDTAGTITTFPFPDNLQQGPYGIAAGSDGNLWYTENIPGVGRIVRLSTSGAATIFPVDAAGDAPSAITAGPDGALWFTMSGQGKIGRITTAGSITIFPVSPPQGSSATPAPVGIVTGPDGNLWFTDAGTNAIGRITPAGVATEFALPTANANPIGITAGPDGNLWFTEASANKIGRFQLAASGSTGGVSTTTATAFATLINSGSTAATGCAIAPTKAVPASFLYQTTSPATNALTGTANTPVNIAAGGSQTFVIAFTPNAAFVPNDVALGFSCSGLAAASSNPGLNTLLLSASSSPVPDIVALGATANNDGILHITGTTGSAAFAVATVDLGASSAITVTANTGSMTLPLTITMCQTVPSSGLCMAAPTSSVTTTINANMTPTFAFFGTASGTIPFSPADTRIFVQFADSGGVVRGSTSVAVETQ